MNVHYFTPEVETLIASLGCCQALLFPAADPGPAGLVVFSGSLARSAGKPAATKLTGRICPLTYLENDLRVRAGQSGYTESFIEHYLLDVIYPSGLTGEVQFVLAATVVVVNIAIYVWPVIHRRT